MKYHYFVFDQIALLKALRMHLIINYIYLCDSLTDVNIYFTTINAIRHELHIIIIKNCFEFRSVKEHEEVKR